MSVIDSAEERNMVAPGDLVWSLRDRRLQSFLASTRDSTAANDPSGEIL
jgi:hypothetical protein